MATNISIKCNGCGKSLNVPATAIGKTGKCPACKTSIKIELPPPVLQPKSIPKPNPKPNPKPASKVMPENPVPANVPDVKRTLVAVAPVRQIDVQPTHSDEIQKDRDRFAAAISVAPDKYPIIRPYLTEYESAIAIAVQRQFPFTFFSDIALLTSHRLMVFRRFFTRISMVDINYVDFGDVKVEQGFFTSSISMLGANGQVFSIDNLITEQALNLYRHCQSIESKARIARRQFQLEENRSRTNQLQINNIAPQPGNPIQSFDTRAIGQRDISNIGDEERDPYRLGE